MSSLVHARAERRQRRVVDAALVADITAWLEAGESQPAVSRALAVSQSLVWRVSKLREARR